MQGYSNLSPNYGQQYGNNGMQRTNYLNYAPAPMGYNYGNQGYGNAPQYPQQPMDERIYVTGRAGAEVVTHKGLRALSRSGMALGELFFLWKGLRDE